jgi:hypothetical protein
MLPSLQRDVERIHAEIVLAHAIVNIRSLRRSRSRRALIRSVEVAMAERSEGPYGQPAPGPRAGPR